MNSNVFFIALPALMGGIFFNLAAVLIKDISGLAKDIKQNGGLNEHVVKLFKRILTYLEISFYITYFAFFIFIIYAINAVLKTKLEENLRPEAIKLIIVIPVWVVFAIILYRIIRRFRSIEKTTLPRWFGKNNYNSAYRIGWIYFAGIVSFTLFLIGGTVGVFLCEGLTDIYFIFLSTCSFLVWVLALLINPLHSYFCLIDLSG